MPHTGIHAISARQDKMNKRWVGDIQLVYRFCCRYLHHLPRLQRSVFNHCQPLQPTALTSISHFIMSHHNSRRLAGSALLGVPWRCSAFLGVARRHRCLQVSTFTDLSVARRIRSVGSVGRRWQALAATTCSSSWRRWQSHGVDHPTPSQYIATIWYLSNKTNKLKKRE